LTRRWPTNAALPTREHLAQSPSGKIKVHRIVCAVDCSTSINPDVITALMVGGIGFGLGAALYGAITLKGG
jgi:CO/xanthine dehydrogenase Mo-binding subunit